MCLVNQLDFYSRARYVDGPTFVLVMDLLFPDISQRDNFIIIVVCFRFQVKKKQFFRNFVTIMLFGAIGTVVSCTVITLGNLNFPFRLAEGPVDHQSVRLLDSFVYVVVIILWCLKQV